MSCNKCKKKSQDYKWCDCNNESPCNEATPKESCEVQLDAKEVFYKLKGDCFSNMSFLDIPKGADLEYILERFAYFIENFSYFDVTPNKYNAPDLKTFIDYLLVDLAVTQNCCKNQGCEINNLKERLTNLETRISYLENPSIVDTHGRGFTINSSLKEVLQSISNS